MSNKSLNNIILGILLLVSASIYSQENTALTCADGIDNDGDGNIDCQDGDCAIICAAALIGQTVEIDFEDVLGESPEVLTPIRDQYLTSGVRFSLSSGAAPVVVDYGGVTEGFSGVGGDTPAVGYDEELGGFFLTDDGISSGLSVATIRMDFLLPVSEVRGQIVDIDNQESFTAVALDALGQVIAEVTVNAGDLNTGNGIPTSWSLQSNGGCIARVVLSGVSDGITSFGYGIDNLRYSYTSLEDLCSCVDPTDSSTWLTNLCLGCTDPLACNFSSDAQADDNSCIFPEGCSNPEACNYVLNAHGDDSSCIFPDGCTDDMACNYDPAAQCDDGSCDHSCLGCMDDAACNFDIEATMDDQSCRYPGCTDSSACNYDSSAGCDDGSCILPNGSTAPAACNFNSSATCDDGSCDFTSYADCAGVPFGASVLDDCEVCLLASDELFNQTCLGDLYIPNSFTPNGDGYNDIWKPVSGRVLTRYEIVIYSSWGTLVYSSSDPEEGWNGNLSEGDYYVNDQLYNYRVIYGYGDSDHEVKTGHITMLR